MTKTTLKSQSPLERVINASVEVLVGGVVNNVSIPFRTGHQCEWAFSVMCTFLNRLNPL